MMLFGSSVELRAISTFLKILRKPDAHWQIDSRPTLYSMGTANVHPRTS